MSFVVVVVVVRVRVSAIDGVSQWRTMPKSGLDYVEVCELRHPPTIMSDIREFTNKDFSRAISAKQRRRLLEGVLESGHDIVAVRRFVGLTQKDFATALGISVHTLRNWEQDRRGPEGPALALLRIAARHPRIIRESLHTAK